MARPACRRGSARWPGPDAWHPPRPGLPRTRRRVRPGRGHRHHPRRCPGWSASDPRSWKDTAMRVLLLGGTTEASALADRLADDSRFTAILSLAGGTRSPVLPRIAHRIGGV